MIWPSPGLSPKSKTLYNGTVEPMPTILYVQGWRFHFYANEGNEPMHYAAFETRGAPNRLLSTSIRSLLHGGSVLEEIVESKTKPVLARAIETTPDALILILESGSVAIPWERCSERLARASLIERSRAELSPSGYGIHWPLIAEDLAVGPLLLTGA